jgi:translation initiation factor IF-2
MAFRAIRLSYSLYKSVICNSTRHKIIAHSFYTPQKLDFHTTGKIIFLASSQIKNFFLLAAVDKRRKTKEEKNQVIEYAPKKKKNEGLDVVDVWRFMTVRELSESMNRNIEDIQEAMLYIKDSPDIHPKTRLEDMNIIKDIVKKCGVKMKIVSAPKTDEKEEQIKDKDVHKRPPASVELLKQRPPVVTVMGHVDHGKTTLLDSLRHTAVAAGEAGGITQHIGAFTVELENGEAVTFLDTPGHAAFSAMRARGAQITDIIVLVVAADDGVMEQTKEVVNLSKTCNVPVIVAINKIDKPDADPEKTKKGLGQVGINLEGHGGDTQFVLVSAKEGTNLQELAETVSTQATLMGLKADCTGPVEGIVVESKNDSKRGKLSTAIITRGTLRRGSILVSGQAHAKVRALFDHAGKPMDKVEPGMPVEILGWRELPFAGEEIIEVESEKRAHAVLHYRHSQAQHEKAELDQEVILLKQMEHDEKYRQAREERRKVGRFKIRRVGPRQKEIIDDDSIPRVSIIIKGDVHGSVEAILDVLDTYHEHERVRLDVVHYGVGDVTEGDLELAKAFNAIIYAFSVNATNKSLPKNVKIHQVDIIYRLIEHLKNEINEKLPMLDVEEVVGE